MRVSEFRKIMKSWNEKWRKKWEWIFMEKTMVRTAEGFKTQGAFTVGMQYVLPMLITADASRSERKGFTGVQQGRYSAFKKASRKFYGQFRWRIQYRFALYCYRNGCLFPEIMIMKWDGEPELPLLIKVFKKIEYLILQDF
jgi:hypothetical protein